MVSMEVLLPTTTIYYYYLLLSTTTTYYYYLLLLLLPTTTIYYYYYLLLLVLPFQHTLHESLMPKLLTQRSNRLHSHSGCFRDVTSYWRNNRRHVRPQRHACWAAALATRYADDRKAICPRLESVPECNRYINYMKIVYSNNCRSKITWSYNFFDDVWLIVNDLMTVFNE
jgi:hypothetical protein